MLSELDGLMNDRGIAAVIVSMHERLDPSFRWLSRGAKVTRGYVVKAAGRDPLLIHYPMERDEAASAGVRTVSIHDFKYQELFRARDDVPAAYAEFFASILRSEGVQSGSVAFCGQAPLNLYLEIADGLQQSGYSRHRSRGEDLLQLARKRKETWELEAIADTGRRTEEVVEGVRAILREASIVSGSAVYRGSPLTLAVLKDFVSSEIARLGMIEDHETILSQGRDAGVPHSRGDRDAVVRASVPIVIDIFPSDRHTGYFFDLTRTFCIGDIPAVLARIHADVLGAWEFARDEMRAGQRAADSQARVCDYFEKRKYPSVRSHPTTNEGYVHSLGHGVGLDVHEKPFFGLSETNRDLIEVGDVLTIEPGLYFPDDEVGVRIEDTFYIAEDGRPVCFSSSDRMLKP